MEGSLVSETEVQVQIPENPIADLVEKTLDSLQDPDYRTAYAAVMVPKIIRSQILYSDPQTAASAFAGSPDGFISQLDKIPDPEEKFINSLTASSRAVREVSNLRPPSDSIPEFNNNDPTIRFVTHVLDKLNSDGKFVIGFQAAATAIREADKGLLNHQVAETLTHVVTDKVDADAKTVLEPVFANRLVKK